MSLNHRKHRKKSWKRRTPLVSREIVISWPRRHLLVGRASSPFTFTFFLHHFFYSPSRKLPPFSCALCEFLSAALMILKTCFHFDSCGGAAALFSFSTVRVASWVASTYYYYHIKAVDCGAEKMRSARVYTFQARISLARQKLLYF